MHLVAHTFHDEMQRLYDDSSPVLRHPSTGYLMMLRRHGAVETARRLVDTRVPSQGFFDLCEINRLDLSVEAAVCNWSHLFDPMLVHKARGRLRDAGYTI